MRKIALIIALTAVPTAGALAQESEDAPPPEMQKLLESCDVHRFEAIIHVTDEGGPHDSKVTVCGKAGQSDADWINTLKQIAGKTAVNQQMPQSTKEQVLAALNDEIVRLTAILPKETPPAPKVDVGEAYSALPPLPAPETKKVELPPAAAAVSAPVVAVPAPRLKLSCIEGRDVDAAEPCDRIERGNLLLVQADEDMAPGVLLKFLRRGESRAEVRLPALRTGQPLTLALPTGLCAGIVHSQIEIRASRAPGSPEASFGPYELRC